VRLKFWLSIATVAAAYGCTDNPNVWIVVDLKMSDGKTAQMAFRNPAIPDLTLDECERTLEKALPSLMEGIESVPETKGSRLVSAKCVVSIKDPLKPKT
jgi:hypothetical protein